MGQNSGSWWTSWWMFIPHMAKKASSPFLEFCSLATYNVKWSYIDLYLLYKRMTDQHTVIPARWNPSTTMEWERLPRWGRPLQTSGMLRWSQYWERTWYLSADHVDRLQKPKVPRSQSGPLERTTGHDITGPPTVVTHEKEDLHSFLLPWTLTRVGHCHPTNFSTGIGFPINSWRAASAKKTARLQICPKPVVYWPWVVLRHGSSALVAGKKTRILLQRSTPSKKNPYRPKSVVRVMMDFMVCDKTSMLLR